MEAARKRCQREEVIRDSLDAQKILRISDRTGPGICATLRREYRARYFFALRQPAQEPDHFVLSLQAFTSLSRIARKADLLDLM